MKLLSVKTILADGGRHTSAVKISDEDAMDEIAVQNAIAAIGGNVESFQIIDTEKETVIETVGTGNEDDQTSDRPRVGIQHADAVGIVDNQPSGDSPVTDDPHREDMGTLEGVADDRKPYVAPEITDLDSKAGADAFAGMGEEDTGKPRRKK